MDKEWINYGHPYWKAKGKSFEGDNLNKPGVLIETKSGVFLIGHINELKGVCDDCTQFGNDEIVIKYKTVWEE